jgi:hypothetical protein
MVEIIQIVLRMIEFCSREVFKIRNPEKFERIMREITATICEFFIPKVHDQIDKKEVVSRKDLLPHFFSILMEFDWQKILEACFASEHYKFLEEGL